MILDFGCRSDGQISTGTDQEVFEPVAKIASASHLVLFLLSATHPRVTVGEDGDSSVGGILRPLHFLRIL